MHPILIRLGPLTLHTYGLMVALGFLAGYYVGRREFDRRGLSLALLDNLVFMLMIGGLVGARLFYFILITPDFFLTDFWSFFRIWEGGLVYYGGFAAGLVILLVVSRVRGLPLLVLLDSLAAPLFIAHALGRLGCFAAGCCYGRPTDSVLGVTFMDPQSLAPIGLALHPTQLYEAAGNSLLFIAVFLLGGRRLRAGALTSFYLIGYGFLRFGVEFLRGDTRGFSPMGLFPGQWLSLALILAGAGLALYVRKNNKN